MSSLDGVATAVAADLHAGRSVSLVYDAPESFTRYDLIFTPSWGVDRHGARSYTFHSEAVLVSLLNYRTCYVFRLFEQGQDFHPTYVGEKLGCSPADAQVLTNLFRKIQEKR